MKNYVDSKSKETGGFKEPDMPFRYYYSDYSKGFPGFTLHWHDEIEVIYIVKGKGTFLIDDEEYLVSEGDIVYISPRLIHSGQAIDNNNFITICYVIDSSYLLSANGEYNTDKYISSLMDTKITQTLIKSKDPGYKKIKNALHMIDLCTVEKGIAYQLEIKMHLYSFFAQLYKNGYLAVSSSRTLDRENEELVKKAINYIQSNFSKQLTVNEIAKHVGLSPSHFMNVFKQHTKVTCIKYINSFRLNIAETILKETDESVLQIAQDCGFNNLSLFNREFKKAYFTTPTQYRKNYRDEAQKYVDEYGYSSGLTAMVQNQKNDKSAELNKQQ